MSGPVGGHTDPPSEGAWLVLDYDGTVIRGDSAHRFALERLRGRRLEQLRYAAVASRFLLGQASNDEYKAFLAGLVRNVPTSLVDFGRFYARECAPRTRPFFRTMVAEWRARGGRVAIVSASFVEWLRHAKQDLGADAIVANRFETKGRIFTGRLLGPNIHGDRKVLALEALFETEGGNLAGCTAFADSASDLPLLDACQEGWLVNPTFWTRRRVARRASAANSAPVRFVRV